MKLRKIKLSIIAKFLDKIVRMIFSCEVPSTIKMGKNIVFAHAALGVVIHPRTVLGNDIKIYQNVTIGSRNGVGPPIVGNNVLIGAGACILGDITIGNNVKIGANAVVTKDVPSNSVVVGIPAKII